MELDEKQKKFVDLYLQTYNIEGSAKGAGYPYDEALSIGIDLLSNEIVRDYLKKREEQFDNISDVLKMDKNKLIRTMYYQYQQATARRDIKTATDILEKIARWSGVNPDEVVMDPVVLNINNVDESKI